MPAPKRVPPRNHLLTGLRGRRGTRFRSMLQLVTLSSGEILHEAGGRVRHVYFPLSAVISMAATMKGSLILELCMVGHEGMVGHRRSAMRATVSRSGTALRMSARRYNRASGLHPELARRISLHADAVLLQAVRNAACSHVHATPARLARWLLTMQDRARAGSVVATQGMLADVLGVRREGVNAAARVLKRGKLLDYARGRVTILDRKRMLAVACGCYPPLRSR